MLTQKLIIALIQSESYEEMKHFRELMDFDKLPNKTPSQIIDFIKKVEAL